MIIIYFLNNSTLITKKPITIKKIFKKIKNKKKKKIWAGKINNKLVDLFFIIKKTVNLEFITKNHKDAIKIIRYSTAYLLANAIKELYPKVQIVIGNVIKNGFYYDFYYKKKLNTNDLIKLEKKMIQLSNNNLPIIKKITTYKKAINYFKLKNELYKIKILKKIQQNQKIFLYSQGNFIDLCKGPHVPYTNCIKIFKIIKISGAYWKNNSKNKMLQRIYGTAWLKLKDQNNYLNKIKESLKRDHRLIGKTLNLFHFQIEAPGIVFWHQNGLIIKQEIEKYIRYIYQKNNYLEIKTPEILDKLLWEKTGHWDNYKKYMITIKNNNKSYSLKPMSCPGHIQMFNYKLHSYRELPIRYGEFGQCYRNELSGSLHGMMRVKSFTQDDGHIFCTKNQIQKEIINFHKLAYKVYNNFGFKKILTKLALRPLQRIGDEKKWDIAENELRKAINYFKNVNLIEINDEGAFYGPKIEYHLQDSMGRYWQCGTIQIDLIMPFKLKAKYIDKNNNYKIPIMLHRAIIGSLERFIAILIENYIGLMPLWLSPIQIIILSISQKEVLYILYIQKILKKKRFRVNTDLRNEKISYKIKQNLLQKPFYILIIGKKEYKTKTISLRLRGNKNINNISINKLFKIINFELKKQK